MDNPVNISDAVTLIFWYRIGLHRNILVLTRVYSFIYARVRSCCSVVEDNQLWRTKTKVVLLYLLFYSASSASAALLMYVYWLNQCITLIVCILMYIIISNVCFNSFMNCYLLLYVIVPLWDSVLFLFLFFLLLSFSFLSFPNNSAFWMIRIWHVWIIVDSKRPEGWIVTLGIRALV